MTYPQSCQKNQILATLPLDECERILPCLEQVLMPLGEALYESGDSIRYIFFPTTCIVSLLYSTENGSSSEIAMVGNEGVIGVTLFMGGDTLINRAIVQNTGYIYRLHKHPFMQEFNRHGTLFHVLLRYTQALITQMTQTALCNRFHSVDKQLCRWLLQNIDRLFSNVLSTTHELIALNLGVQRESVTEAAKKLQKAGIIDYSRGHIIVVDKSGLEARACECYQVVKSEYNRLLGTTLHEPRISRIDKLVHHESHKDNKLVRI